MGKEEINPHLDLLGISENEHPLNHYRLLGIKLFESNLNVIEHSINQRTAYLRSLQNELNDDEIRRLLSEIAAARTCLLNPIGKAAYDNTLGIPHSEMPDFSGDPPFQFRHEPVVKRRSSFPTKTVTLLLTLCLGLSYTIWHFNSKQQQLAHKTTDRGLKNRNGQTAAETAKPSGNPDPKTSSNKISGDSSSGKDGNEKNPDSASPVLKTNSDPMDSNPLNTRDENSKSSKPATNKNEDKNNVPLIIGTKSKAPKKQVVREPIPSSSRWRPFLNVLRAEFRLQDNIARDARYGIFNNLVKDASEEVRPDRSYAMFNLALEIAGQLNHSSGSEHYCDAISGRFEIDHGQATVWYLKTLLDSTDSDVHIAKLLVDTQQVVRRYEQEKDFQVPTELLESIVKLATRNIGKNVNGPYFESWLNASRLCKQISDELDELRQVEKQGQLSPQQHRMLGTYECFIAENWTSGLQHYVDCDLKTVSDLAREALAINVTNVKAISNLADRWWELSEKAKDEKHLFRRRAKHWYDELGKLVKTDEIPKTIQKRTEELTLEIGLVKLPTTRSPSKVFIFDRDKTISATSLGTTSRLVFFDDSLLGIISGEGGQSRDSTRFQVIHTGYLNTVFNESAGGFISHPPVKVAEKIAWLKPRQGISTFDMNVLLFPNQNKSAKQNSLQVPFPIRAFDISDKGDVFALADKYIYWWNPQQAWAAGQGGKVEPVRIEPTVAFIPNRLFVIPSSSFVALADSRNLIRLNPKSKGISELHAGGELNDFVFSDNGYFCALALKNGIRRRSLKSGSELFFRTGEATQVRFLPNPRFLVSLHRDYSIRIWDTADKQKDYLIERFDSTDFKPTQFAVSTDGKVLAAVGESSTVRLFQLFYQ